MKVVGLNEALALLDELGDFPLVEVLQVAADDTASILRRADSPSEGWIRGPDRPGHTHSGDLWNSYPTSDGAVVSNPADYASRVADRLLPGGPEKVLQEATERAVNEAVKRTLARMGED